MATGALAGLKVIDLSRVLGGPFSTQILGDHGADIIKVEPPKGDETRSWGPPFQGKTASYFMGLNRNKRAIVLNLAQKAGQDILLHMLEEADVLVENFVPGTMEKWGLGYKDVLAQRFPRLIHCCISGFGADGPLGGLPGYDAIIQAMGGIMSINGIDGGEPTRIGVPAVDMVTGMNAVIGIMMALYERNRSGLGQYVDTALFDSGVGLLHPHAANYFMSGKIPAPTGNNHPNISPYSLYQTATRPVYLTVGNDGQFAKLCALIGKSELAQDPRFKTNGDRVTNRDALRQELEALLASHDGDELSVELMRKGVPCGPVNNVGESLNHPHTRHRNMVVEIDDYRGLGAPVKLGRTKVEYRRKPPEFAQHTDEILREFGYSAAAIAAFKKDGTVC